MNKLSFKDNSPHWLGVKQNFWIAKSLTLRHLRMGKVIFQVMHIASYCYSLTYQICWELMI